MESKIIGIHDGHNAAAALLDSGKITFAVQEERHTRNKNESGIPNLSIRQLLTENNLSMHDIDIVAAFKVMHHIVDVKHIEYTNCGS